MVTIKLTSELSELEGIRQLQELNLTKNITEAEAQSQGFLSAAYSLEFLKLMHDEHPSVIAKDGDTVVGYALVSPKTIKGNHPLLDDLFGKIDDLTYNEIPLKNTNYVVVGQLCVSKEYRGQGLVKQLYNYYRECLSRKFDYCITDVASDNPRSRKSHLSVGFTVIATMTYGGISWDIILWDWKG